MSTSTSSTSTSCSLGADRCFEDFQVGAKYEFGSITVDEAEVIEFARRYDPQVFHVDPEAAKKTVFGGLIASGWHTGAMMMRLMVDNYLMTVESIGSPGLDELRWLKPVRPGDVLSVRVTVLEASRSRSKPGWGVIRSLIEVINQNREVVMTVKAVNLVLCREKNASCAME
jgi:acyl dehydratase